MSAALDHEAREVLRLAADFLSPVASRDIEAFVLSATRGEWRSINAWQWQFDMEYEADLGSDCIRVTWSVWTETDSVDGDPPRTRTKVMKVEVSRG